MAKIYDITEKLKKSEKPVIKLGDRDIVVQNSAERVLRFIDESRAVQEDPSAMQRAAMNLFDAEDWEYLTSELTMEDLATVIAAAIQMAQGSEPTIDDKSGF